MISTNSERWAAEMTTAAYAVAMRHCATSRWLELQLALWRALSATFENTESDMVLQSEDFCAEAADVAYRVALPFGRRRSFLELELELYQTLRQTAAKARA